MTTPLGTLLGNSFSFWKSHSKAILVGSIVLAIVTTYAQVSFIDKMETGVSSIMNEMGMDPDRMEELAKRIEDGDKGALEEMLGGLGVITDGKDGLNEDATKAIIQTGMRGMLTAVLPSLGIMVLVSLLVSLIASSYFLVIAVKDVKDSLAAIGQVPGLIFPLLGVWIWAFIRSFAWIPIIGIIFAIVLGPRFLCAPVILVRDKKGVFESVSESYAVTRGYWGKIFGNMIVMAICMIVVSMVVGIVIGLIGGMSTVATSFGLLFVKQLTAAYGIIFVVQLAGTIMQNTLVATND